MAANGQLMLTVFLLLCNYYVSVW